MSGSEFDPSKATEGLGDKPKKAKDAKIEGVIEWLVRIVAAKDATGLVNLIEAAGDDQAKIDDALKTIKSITRTQKPEEVSALEELLSDFVGNKDKIVEKVKEIVTGDPKDAGVKIKNVNPELSSSYKDLIEWIDEAVLDPSVLENKLIEVRKLDISSLEKVERKIEALTSADKIKNKNFVTLIMSQIQKERIEKREVRRSLTKEDSEKVGEQARKMKTQIEKRVGSGGIDDRAQADIDKRHLAKAVEVMAKVVVETKRQGKSIEEYVASGEFSDDERVVLISGMEVIRREAGSSYGEFEEILTLAQQIKEAWGGESLARAYEQRQKIMAERYGRNVQRGSDNERFMPQRASEKYLRSHPEILQDMAELDDFGNMLLDPEANIQDYFKRNRMGLNVDYDLLTKDDDDLVKALRNAGLEGIIDLETLKTKGVPSLKEEGYTQEQRKQAENIILQELLKAVRVLVADGVEGSAMMYDPRATRYLTLLTISGVSPDLKQTVGAHMKLHYMEYMWRNGYVDEEVYGRLLKFFSEQGPEYRLHEALKIREKFVLKGKEGKEVDIGEFNLYDFEKYLTRNVSAEDKAHFGMPADVDRTYATAMATKVTSEAMAADRMVFLRSMLKDHLGTEKYQELINQFDSEEDFLAKFMGKEGKYNDYIHKSYIFWIGNGRLGEVVGNGNLKSNDSFELCQGVPEYYYKRDPRLMIMFLWAYKPQLVPDVLAPMMRMGITSLASMYGEEIATHLISLEDSSQGARGIKSTFFKGGNEEYAKAWRLMWEDSLYDYDEYHTDSHGHGHAPIYFEKSSKKSAKDGKHDALTSRRTNTDTINRLNGWMAQIDADTKLGASFYESIDWDWAIKKFEHNKELINFLKSDAKGRKKLEYFIHHFGDDYFVTDGLKAKRGDAWLKYMGKYQDEFFKATVEYATNPEVETMAKLVAIVNSIVGVGKVGPFVERMREVLYYMSKSRVIGEKYQIFKVDEEGRIIFDPSRWVGSNKGEFPLPQVETITVTPSMDINKKSALAYRGLENKRYEPLLERVMLRDLRAANAFPSIKEYQKAVWKWRMGLLWEKDRSVLINLASLLTGRSISEFIAIGLFELPPHVFWEWFFENTEKSWETSMKVFAGASHH